MAQFKYTARNSSGQLISKVIEAEDRSLAAQIINSRGMTPISIVEATINTDLIEQFNHWRALSSLNINDLMMFSRQMHSMSKAGVPLIRTLRSLTESTRNPALAEALKDIAKRLEAGTSLSQAMNQHKKVFSPLFINIIHVGETSGELDQAFLQIANYLDREKETQSRIKSALRYPSMVIIAISIAMVVINIYVIPSFKSVFDRMQAELPWQTKAAHGHIQFYCQLLALPAGRVADLVVDLHQIHQHQQWASAMGLVNTAHPRSWQYYKAFCYGTFFTLIRHGPKFWCAAHSGHHYRCYSHRQ